MPDRDHVTSTFATVYGAPPEGLTRAPGRVNLIGEHTDYNDGFCLPMAIDRAVLVGWRRRPDQQIQVASLEAGLTPISFVCGPLIAKADKENERWTNYVRGCAQILVQANVPVVGVDLLLSGDVPLGSGLSSSAALEVAIIHALLAASNTSLDGTRIATLAQRAENTYVGTNCGILDQLSSSMAVAGQAMLMDCRTLTLTPAPLPPGVKIVIADTGKRRGLVDSAYNERRRQCEAGATALGVSHLRDATLHSLHVARRSGKLDALAFDRCAHVVAENGRTQAAFACLMAGDAPALGALMDQSHADLRDRFAVTGPELDTMVELARALPGCLGSRMTGAGFGGCTVSLVQSQHVENFAKTLEVQFRKAHPTLTPAIYVTGAANGAGRL